MYATLFDTRRKLLSPEVCTITFVNVQLINAWTTSTAENILDDAALVEAVIYKANVIQAKAGEGMYVLMN
jgi:hypothetical protein